MSDTKNLAYWRKRGPELMAENAWLREALERAASALDADLNSSAQRRAMLRQLDEALMLARAALTEGCVAEQMEDKP